MSSEPETDVNEGHAVPGDPVAGSRDSSKSRSSLARTHEELYGCLLGVDKSLSNGSALLVWLFLLIGAATMTGVYHGWFDGPVGRDLSFLRSPLVCGLWMFAMLYLGLCLNTLRRRAIYRRRRRELLEAVRDSGLRYHAVISRIKNDQDLARVATRLGADKSFHEDLVRGPTHS